MHWTLERVSQNILFDVQDKFRSKKPPLLSETTFSSEAESKRVLDRICPPEIIASIRSKTAEFPKGTYLARTVVGEKLDPKRHPHDFVIDKGDDSIQCYFVDPEHFVGERMMTRPSISNLMALTIPNSEDDQPSICILRYRTESLAKEHLEALKMSAQLGLAKELMDHAALPTLIANHPQEILFRTRITREGALLQSRYVSNVFGLDLFLAGEKSAPVLEGKIAANVSILKRFVQLLDQGNFKKTGETVQRAAGSPAQTLSASQ